MRTATIETNKVKKMLEEILKNSNITEVSEKTGITRATLYNIINESHDFTKTEIARNLAVAYNYLVKWDKNGSMDFISESDIIDEALPGDKPALTIVGNDAITYQYLKQLNLLDPLRLRRISEIVDNPVQAEFFADISHALEHFLAKSGFEEYDRRNISLKMQPLTKNNVKLKKRK